ncbi:MAG: sulfatase-like hydrolase/transferase [Acidobacteria bacterium]|nr:sulfatase-like hydrolase/transferase [Acidobacteriota bacterium]
MDLLCVLSQVAAAEPKPAVKSGHDIRPNVLLITIDTVRADHLGCYGYAKIQTATLDALAHDGIVFEHAIAQVPLTWPSHTAILTGTYPFQNGVQDFTGQPLDARFRSLAQAFQKNGYATGAVVSAYVLDRLWGLARGFDFYDDAFSPEAFREKDIGLVDRKAGESVAHAIRWLTKQRQAAGPDRHPFFLWLHLYDPHSPYDPPEPYRTDYRDRLYDGEIAYADHELGRLIAWLKDYRLYQNSAIVVLSDHGESLGEHGEQEHGFFLYNSTVRVPLIVKPPATRNLRAGRSSTPVETIAVAPTLLRLAGLKDEIEKQFIAADLIRQKQATEPVYSETFYPFNSFGWSPLHSLESDRYHYIDAPRPELYDIAADPEEKHNLASEQNAVVAVLKDKLHSLLEHKPFTPAADASTAIAPDALEKLRALGYVAYHSPVSPDAIARGLPDPKDKLEEFNRILEAEDAIHADSIAQGEAILANIEHQDPSLYIVPFLLGETAARQKDWAKSAQEFKRCLELNPNFDQAMTGLARTLFSLGQAEEAKQWARNALKFNPSNYKAWYELGSIESGENKAAAISDYEKAVAIQGNFSPLRRDLGMLYFEQQNYPEAAKNLAKAAELGVNDALLFNYLGICYDRIGRLAKAIESFRHALDLQENLAEAHLNLGFTYQRLGREAVASAEYQRACQLKQDFCKLVPSGR